MNPAVPRIAAPLLLMAAIAVSFAARTPQPAPPPIVLEPGALPEPPRSEMEAAYASAFAPGAPGYDRGVTAASVTVLEFADFGCRYCALFATETYPRLADEFVRTGKVRWRYVPFVLGMFPNGEDAARAAVCAAEQRPSAFGAMHDRLFAQRDEWMQAANAAGPLRNIAAGIGLDGSRFSACVAGEDVGGRVRAANELADRLGVRSTPTFFVNGSRVEGALPWPEFRAVLLEALRNSPQSRSAR